MTQGRKFGRYFLLALSLLILEAATLTCATTGSLEISPALFDFGWCPDNAQVSTDFTVKNVSSEEIPLTAVQPTCGCTATNFTPGSLPTNDVKKIGLTFNTRGYKNAKFHKSAKVKTDSAENEYSVTLAGHVTNPEAKIFPVGTGIAEFLPGAKESSQKISIQNNLATKVNLEVVQQPASWAKVKLRSKSIEPGKTADLDISVNPPYDEQKHTSITFEAVDNETPHRLTVAIRTGVSPFAAPRIQPPPANQQAPATQNKPTGSQAPASSTDKPTAGTPATPDVKK